MALEAIHKAIDDIPEEYRPLYSERNGQFELTGIAGVKTQADVDRLTVAIDKERTDHKETKAKLTPWGEMDFEATQKSLDRIPELEAAAGDKGIDEEKMNELVEGRITTRLAPIERENATLKTQLGEATEVIGDFRNKETKRTIHDSVRAACIESKVLDVAHEDALFLAERVFEIREDDGKVVTKDGVGVTPGILAQDWLTEMGTKRPHWWAPSEGGGAGGGGGGGIPGGGKNPWAADNWNITNQSLYAKEHGTEKAMATAKAAGSSLGAIHPPVKKK